MENVPKYTKDQIEFNARIMAKMLQNSNYIEDYRKKLENGTPIITFKVLDPLNEQSKRQKLLLELEQLLTKYGVREFMYSRKV